MEEDFSGKEGSYLERDIETYFKAAGFQTERNKIVQTPTVKHEIDVYAVSPYGHKIMIECKFRRRESDEGITKNYIDALIGKSFVLKMDRAVIVTNARVSDEIKKYGRQNGIAVWDGLDLDLMKETGYKKTPEENQRLLYEFLGFKAPRPFQTETQVSPQQSTSFQEMHPKYWINELKSIFSQDISQVQEKREEPIEKKEVQEGQVQKWKPGSIIAAYWIFGIVGGIEFIAGILVLLGGIALSELDAPVVGIIIMVVGLVDLSICEELSKMKEWGGISGIVVSIVKIIGGFTIGVDLLMGTIILLSIINIFLILSGRKYLNGGSQP